jgi:phage-related protein
LKDRRDHLDEGRIMKRLEARHKDLRKLDENTQKKLYLALSLAEDGMNKSELTWH